MASCMFAFPNHADAATVSGGSWNTTMPLANVLDPVIGNRARTVNDDLASTQFDVDLGAARGVRVVALAGHNFSAGATYRIRGSNTAGDFTTAPLHDSGTVGVWALTYLSGSVPWESSLFWTATMTMSGLDGGLPTMIHLLDAEVGARYWRIEISDTANSDGYVEIGRLFLARVFQPTANFSYGVSIQYADDSTMETAWSGTEYFDRRTLRRVVSMQFDWLTDAEAMSGMLDMQRLQGQTREILFIYDPDDTTYFAPRSFLARAESLSPIEHVRVGNNAVGVRLRELI